MLIVQFCLQLSVSLPKDDNDDEYKLVKRLFPRGIAPVVYEGQQQKNDDTGRGLIHVVSQVKTYNDCHL